MLIVSLVFVFFALVAVVEELHTITDRLIEIGTIVEHFNRRDSRASGMESNDDFAGESITKTHRKWWHVLGGIVAFLPCRDWRTYGAWPYLTTLKCSGQGNCATLESS
jgi:hypothetical protein